MISLIIRSVGGVFTPMQKDGEEGDFSTLLKAAGMAFLLFSGASSETAQPDLCLKRHVNPLSLPDTCPPASHTFPEYIRGFPHNGDWHVSILQDPDASFSCVIPDPSYLRSCVPVAKKLQDYVNSDPDAHKQVYEYHPRNPQGFLLGLPLPGEETKYVSLGVDPQERISYEKALDKAASLVLDPSFSEVDIEESLKEVHQMLEYKEPGGVYRKHKRAVIQKDNKAGDIDAIFSLVVERNGKGAEETFIRANNKFFIKGDLSTMTKDEKKVWESVYHTPPPSQEVSKHMKAFVKEYREKLRSEIDPFELASWVHMQIVNIHAFVDCNGRLARIFMNTELMRGGYDPVVFLDDQTYDQAVEKERKSPGVFCDFLKESYEKTKSLRTMTNFPSEADWIDGVG